MNGVIKRSKDDSNGLQPEKFETYQILRPDELVFKLIDLQNVSTSRVGLSPYLGLVSPAYIILKSNKRVLPAFAEKYFLMLWKNQIFNALGDYQMAMEMDFPDAIERMAEAYLGDELGLEKDEKIALKLFKRAAKLGNAAAQYNLGMAYGKFHYRLPKEKRQIAEFQRGNESIEYEFA